MEFLDSYTSIIRSVLNKTGTQIGNPNKIYGFDKVFRIFKNRENVFVLKSSKYKDHVVFTGRWEKYKGVETPNNNQYYKLGNVDYNTSEKSQNWQCDMVVRNMKDLGVF
jgi:hypothetical protein